ncbi:MAG: IclR family transcriptional regulator [Candidatus Dormibacteria bacterium]
MSGTDSEPQHLARLMAVLQTICDDSGHPTYRDIAQRVGLPVSTTHRLVAMLTSAGLCGRRPDGTLVPGVQLVSLGLRAMERIQPLPSCQDLVSRLSRETNESVSFGMLAGGTILLIARQECEQTLRAVARIGDIMPPHRTAMGKAILAHLPVEQRLRLLRRASGSDAADLLDRLGPELERALECGYAIDDEEFAQGLRCLAAPVFDHTGHLAGAISISGPIVRFTSAVVASCVPLLKETCALFAAVGAAA